MLPLQQTYTQAHSILQGRADAKRKAKKARKTQAAQRQAASVAAGSATPTVAAGVQPAVPVAMDSQPAAATGQLATAVVVDAQAAKAGPVLAATSQATMQQALQLEADLKGAAAAGSASGDAAAFPGPVAGPAPAFGPLAGTHLTCDELEAQAMPVTTPEEAAELQHKLTAFRAKMASIEGVSAVRVCLDAVRMGARRGLVSCQTPS